MNKNQMSKTARNLNSIEETLETIDIQRETIEKVSRPNNNITHGRATEAHGRANLSDVENANSLRFRGKYRFGTIFSIQFTPISPENLKLMLSNHLHLNYTLINLIQLLFNIKLA
jgi:hypothetical protein